MLSKFELRALLDSSNLLSRERLVARPTPELASEMRKKRGGVERADLVGAERRRAQVGAGPAPRRRVVVR